MNTSKEVYALSRVLYLLDEYSVTYLAEQDHSFRAAVERVSENVAAEIDHLQRLSGRIPGTV